jgi:hypothetical protein
LRWGWNLVRIPELLFRVLSRGGSVADLALLVFLVLQELLPLASTVCASTSRFAFLRYD